MDTFYGDTCSSGLTGYATSMSITSESYRAAHLFRKFKLFCSQSAPSLDVKAVHLLLYSFLHLEGISERKQNLLYWLDDIMSLSCRPETDYPKLFEEVVTEDLVLPFVNSVIANLGESEIIDSPLSRVMLITQHALLHCPSFLEAAATNKTFILGVVKGCQRQTCAGELKYTCDVAYSALKVIAYVILCHRGWWLTHWLIPIAHSADISPLKQAQTILPSSGRSTDS